MKYVRLAMFLLVASLGFDQRVLAADAPADSTAALGTTMSHGALVQREGKIEASNDEWFRTGVRVNKGDLVIILADGTVKLGELTGSSGPSGASGGVGALEARIGSGSAFLAGGRHAFIAAEPGLLKLRVRDSKYGDNSGSFAARVILVPGGALPAPLAFAGDDE